MKNFIRNLYEYHIAAIVSSLVILFFILGTISAHAEVSLVKCHDGNHYKTIDLIIWDDELAIEFTNESGIRHIRSLNNCDVDIIDSTSTSKK